MAKEGKGTAKVAKADKPKRPPSAYNIFMVRCF